MTGTDDTGHPLHSDGGGSVPEAPEPPPAEIGDLVEACREFVRRALALELDLSADTLPVLDHYLSLVRSSAEERPTLVPLVTRAVGAYFGELVRRRIGGFWFLPDADVHHWLLCATPVYLSLNPVGIAYDALYGQSDHDGPSAELRLAPEDREAVEKRLALLPPVSESDYFLLSTRLEVLDIAVDALRAQMMAGGRQDVTFEPADYEGDLELDG